MMCLFRARLLLQYCCHCRKKKPRAVAQYVVIRARIRGGGGDGEVSSSHTKKDSREALSTVLQGHSQAATCGLREIAALLNPFVHIAFPRSC